MADAPEPPVHPDDDPAAMPPGQLGDLLSRVYVPCFQKGQRVRIKKSDQTYGRFVGLTGTVDSASSTAAYVALDQYVNDGDPDPFRFSADELEWIKESTEEEDAPGPYLAAMDYLAMLPKLGYVNEKRGPADHLCKYVLTNWTKSPHAGKIKVSVQPQRDGPTAYIAIMYISGGECAVLSQIEDTPMIEVVDRLREIERLIHDPSTNDLSGFLGLLQTKGYPQAAFSDRDRLFDLFGESCLQEAGEDDPEVYIERLKAAAVVIDEFRLHGVRLARKPGEGHPYYDMFWLVTAVTDVSYDLRLHPQPDGAWLVTATGSKEFADPEHQVDGCPQAVEFEVDDSWIILPEEGLDAQVVKVLRELRTHTGPDEPPSAEVDRIMHGDLPESMDDDAVDPKAYVNDTLDAEKILTELGYVLKGPDTRHEAPYWDKQVAQGIRFEVRTHDLEWGLQTWKQLSIRKHWDMLAVYEQDYWLERFREIEDEPDEDLGLSPREALRAARELYYAEAGPEWYWTYDGFLPGTHLLRTLRTDLTELEAMAKAGTLLGRVQADDPGGRGLGGEPVFEAAEPHPDDAVDAEAYAATTLDNAAFLTQAGWTDEQVAAQDGKRFKKMFPLPHPYALGGMTFTEFFVRLYYETRQVLDPTVILYFGGQHHMPVANWRLCVTYRYPFNPESDVPPDSALDMGMSIRRFVAGLDACIAKVLWPEGEEALVASNAVKAQLEAFIKDLNKQADIPLRPAPVEESAPDDPDAPEHYVSRLTTKPVQVLPALGLKSWFVVRSAPADENPEGDLLGWYRKPDPTSKYGDATRWTARTGPGEERLFNSAEECLCWLQDVRNDQPKITLEAIEDEDNPEHLINQLGTLAHVLRLHGFEEFKSWNNAAGAEEPTSWKREVKLLEPVKCGNPPLTTDTFALRVNTNVKRYRHPDQKRYQVVVALYPQTRFGSVLWSAAEDFMTESVAAERLKALLDRALPWFADTQWYPYMTRCEKQLRIIASNLFNLRKNFGRTESLDDPDTSDAEVKRRLDELPPAGYITRAIPADVVRIQTALLRDVAAANAHADRDPAGRSFDMEVRFPDGTFMVIQVCSPDEPDEPYWAQGVLYDEHGNEMGCTDVTDTLLGEFSIRDNDRTYTVNVVSEEPDRPVNESVDDLDAPEHYISRLTSKEPDVKQFAGNRRWFTVSADGTELGFYRPPVADGFYAEEPTKWVASMPAASMTDDGTPPLKHFFDTKDECVTWIKQTSGYRPPIKLESSI